MGTHTIDRGPSEGGTFTCGTAAATTIVDPDCVSTSRIVCFPTNAAAGLLLRSKTCSVAAGNGTFDFNVSATGAGAPAGTETFAYFFSKNS